MYNAESCVTLVHQCISALNAKNKHNVLRLCEEADFGALNCQYTAKFDAR